jgi:alpha-amylase/alpha-mannosidase (GH57 family)
MREDALNVLILWHLHQPPYKDPKTNSFVLPWVRLHATKNYLMMTEVLKRHPGVHIAFNITCCLMDQLEAYTLGETDVFLDLTMKPASHLTPEEKEELLWCCFLLNWEKQVARYPRYIELLSKRGRNTTKEKLRERLKFFSDQDFLDLQVLFNLAWFNIMHLEGSPLSALLEKGRGFVEGDKQALREAVSRIVSDVLPSYIELEARGQIELSTTPYYHPIMPLLCDAPIARVAMPGMSLPHTQFSHPEDATAQLVLAIEKYRSLIGHVPQGIWPSEGSVSEEVVEIMGEAGIRWIATDEEILARSKNMAFTRGQDSLISHPELLYRPSRAGASGKEVALFFRDRYLSDHIGFVYSRIPAAQSVKHFMDYLNLVHRSVKGKVRQPVISIILDGENPWEYYDRDGTEFLEALYGALEKAENIRTVTPAEYLADPGRTEPLERLDWIFPGSWINANFRIWIGHHEDNKAWDLLAAARKKLVEYTARSSPEDTAATRAWQEIYMAEGSDWFWWYGDDHSSATDVEFDKLFRMHLMRVYELIGVKAPPELFKPIPSAKKRFAGFKAPTGKLTIHLDGRVTSFYEWYEAGRFATDRAAGARAIEEGCVDLIRWGESSKNLAVRVDFREGVKPGTGIKLFLKVVSPVDANILIYEGTREGSIVLDGQHLGQFVYRDILELYIDFEALSMEPGEEILFNIVEHSPSGLIFQYPETELLSLKAAKEDDQDWIV